MRSPCTATKSSLCSPQLEKARAQQRRPNADKKKKNVGYRLSAVMPWRAWRASPRQGLGLGGGAGSEKAAVEAGPQPAPSTTQACAAPRVEGGTLISSSKQERHLTRGGRALHAR